MEEKQKLEIEEKEKKLNEKLKLLENENQKALEENTNNKNLISEKEKNIEKMQKISEDYEKQIQSLNKIIAKNEEKKKEKISLIFELDKLLSNKEEKKAQFIIEEKRNKKFIQIINSLFVHYPLLKHINIKSFENKNDSSKINYYSTPTDNNLNDNSIVSIKLD